jgi:hypothetical protein
MYLAIVQQLSRSLQNLSGCLEKAAKSAADRKFEPSVLLAARLAPDQFALLRQVQIACDGVKLTAARLSGKDAPKHEDNETTIAQLQDRIASVVAYLATFTEADFAGTDERQITLPWMPGLAANGKDFVLEFSVPNCLFHITTAYAILRHNGVDLGKMDYLGKLSFHPVPAATSSS